jgi:hypothetical protein
LYLNKKTTKTTKHKLKIKIICFSLKKKKTITPHAHTPKIIRPCFFSIKSHSRRIALASIHLGVCGVADPTLLCISQTHHFNFDTSSPHMAISSVSFRFHFISSMASIAILPGSFVVFPFSPRGFHLILPHAPLLYLEYDWFLGQPSLSSPRIGKYSKKKGLKVLDSWVVFIWVLASPSQNYKS